ncbi:MAG: linear amide C-N hydrolase [Clostridia bacterium]|nr:linear amide C-N hydrolase [Clostridia bacterium]
MKKQILRRAESKTLDTLKVIHPGIFMLEFNGDYGLDELLGTGAKDIAGMARFIQRRTRRIAPVLNMKPVDFACSAFNVRNENGNVLMGRNFDYKESPCLILWTHPENGYRSINTLTVNFMLYGVKHQRLDRQKRPLRLMGAPYVCMDGMNEMGLACAILEIKARPTKQSTGRIPVIPPIIVRTVLDKCSTVDEAIEQFSKYDMNDLIGVNYHYMLADAEGRSAVIEYVDDKISIIRPAKEGDDTVVTNYFLTDGADNTKGRGFDRFDDISERLCGCGHSMSELDVMELLSRNTLYYHHPRLPHMVTTCWSNVFDLEEKTLLNCCGMEYAEGYKFSLDKPCEYERISTGIKFEKKERH